MISSPPMIDTADYDSRDAISLHFQMPPRHFISFASFSLPHYDFRQAVSQPFAIWLPADAASLAGHIADFDCATISRAIATPYGCRYVADYCQPLRHAITQPTAAISADIASHASI
jgi:hypothetical protein